MTVEIFGNGGQVITGEHIPMFRLRVLLSGLKLELKGLRMSRGRSAYSIIKQEFRLKGNKQKVYDQFVKIVEKREADMGIPAASDQPIWGLSGP